MIPARARGRRSSSGESQFVVIEDNGDKHVRATVHGRESHEVLLRFEPPTSWSVSCTCVLFRKTGACKHLWAVVLEVDERRLSLSSHLEGVAPADSLTPLDPVREVWRGRLDAVLEDLAGTAPDPWDGILPTRQQSGVQLLYILDLDDTKSGRGLVLRPFWRELHRNHRWSRRRPFDPEEEGAVELTDPADQRIFRGLRSARRSAWTSTAHLSSYGGSGAWWLDDEECELLLPQLCETGRAFLHHRGQDEADPLTWDVGEPWAFGVQLELTRTAGQARLSGYLVRRGERMELDEPHLILHSGFVFTARRVARCDARDAWPLLEDLRSDGPLEGPADDAGELAQRVIDLPGHPLLEGEGLHLAEPREPTPHLELSGLGAEGNALACRILFRYGGTEVAVGEARGALREPETGQVIRRVWKSEREALRAFLSAGGRRSSGADGIAGTVDARDLEELVLGLSAAGWTTDIDGKSCKPSGEVQLQIRSGIDWFDLEGGVRFGENLAPISKVLEAISAGQRSIRLQDGSLGFLSDDLRHEWSLFAGIGEVQDGALRFQSSQGWLLDRLLAAQPGVAWDERFEKLRDTLANFSGLKPEQEPESFQGELRSYQRVGLAWFRFLRDTGFGGCLADDMGLGKTIEVLALLESRRKTRGEPMPSLVVVPRSVLFNWRAEAERFTPDLTVLVHTGIEREARMGSIPDHDLVLTTYGTLRRDIPKLQEFKFDYVVLDEAQAVKNAASHSAKAVRLLRAGNRLALSGTPIENHLGELWSLFEFLNPGMLGRARSFKRLLSSRNEGALDENGRALLASSLGPFLLRRTKAEVLPDLPPKVEQILWCELEGEQLDDYEGLRQHYRQGLIDKSSNRDRFWVLSALLRMRQAACHPSLIEKERIDESSAKLEVLMPHLEEIVESGHKALVFSQFTSHLAVVRKRLDELKLEYAYLDGQTRDREGAVKRFREDPTCPLMLMSLKAGGLGLNLVEADYVFLMDPWWNPAAETQAIDRAHRIGRKNKVIAYRLIARGTIEEKILALQESKRALVEAVLPTGDSFLANLSHADITSLFE